MAAGKQTSPSIAVSFAGKVMTSYVTKINNFKVNGMEDVTTAFGASWETNQWTGVNKIDDVTIEGFYDDTVTNGPDAVFNTIGTTGTLLLTWGDSKTSSVTAWPKSYERKPSVGHLTGYVAVLRVTGLVTEV